MALPLLRGVTAPAISSGAVSAPASTQVGDLLIFLVWSQGTVIPGHAIQSGFFEWRTRGHDDGTTDGRASVCVKEATVAGAQSYTPYSITNASANQTCIGVIVLQAGTWNRSMLTVAPVSTDAVLTTTAVPNPPSVAGLSGDYYMLAIGFWHVTTAAATAATAMASYVIETQNASASHVTHIAAASRSITAASSEDPAAFGDNVAPNGSVAMTIAVRGIMEVTSGAIAVDAGGAVTIASSVREASSGALAIAGPGSIAVDGVVTAGGAEHTSGALEVGGAGAVVISGTLRETFDVAAASGAGVIAVAGVRETFSGAVATAGDGSVAIGGAVRETSAGAIALGGAGSVAIAGAVREAVSGALDLAGAGVIAIALAGDGDPVDPWEDHAERRRRARMRRRRTAGRD